MDQPIKIFLDRRIPGIRKRDETTTTKTSLRLPTTISPPSPSLLYDTALPLTLPAIAPLPYENGTINIPSHQSIVHFQNIYDKNAEKDLIKRFNTAITTTTTTAEETDSPLIKRYRALYKTREYNETESAILKDEVDETLLEFYIASIIKQVQQNDNSTLSSSTDYFDESKNILQYLVDFFLKDKHLDGYINIYNDKLIDTIDFRNVNNKSVDDHLLEIDKQLILNPSMTIASWGKEKQVNDSIVRKSGTHLLYGITAKLKMEYLIDDDDVDDAGDNNQSGTPQKSVLKLADGKETRATQQQQT